MRGIGRIKDKFLSFQKNLEKEPSRFFSFDLTKKIFGDFLSNVNEALNNLFTGLSNKTIKKFSPYLEKDFFLIINLSLEESNLIKDLLERSALDILSKPESELTSEREGELLFFINKYDLIVNDYQKIEFRIRMGIKSTNFDKLTKIVREHGTNLKVYSPAENSKIPFFYFFEKITVDITNIYFLDNLLRENVTYYLQEELNAKNKFNFNKGKETVAVEGLRFCNYSLNKNGSLRVYVHSVRYKSDKYDFNIEYKKDMKFSKVFSNEIGNFNISLEFNREINFYNVYVNVEIENIKNKRKVYLEMGEIGSLEMSGFRLKSDKFYYILIEDPETKRRAVVRFNKDYNFVITEIDDKSVEMSIRGPYRTSSATVKKDDDDDDDDVKELGPKEGGIDRLPVINANYPFTSGRDLSAFNIKVTKEDLAKLIFDFLFLDI